MDRISEQKLASVNPDLAARVHQMADALSRRGIVIKVSSGLRSVEKQAALYADRANNPNPVAKPGTSKHEKGLAIDVVPVGSYSASVQRAIGEEGKRAGLLWGGEFKRPDPVHFELSASGIQEYVRNVVSDATTLATRNVLRREVKNSTESIGKQALLLVGGVVVLGALLLID